MNPLLKGFKAATRPADRSLPWEWCERHVVVDNTSPMPGRWRSDSSPWVKELMEVCADNHIRRVAVKCSAQSSKTQTILNLLCWAISEDPGPSMWVMANKDDAKDFFKDRVTPTFDHCGPVASQLIESEGLTFRFASMPLYFVGAGSPSKLQSKPIRWLLLDEVRNYPPKALDTVLKRTRSFWNSRQIIISTPSLEGDTVDRSFKEGDQRTYHFPCPACGQLQPLKLEQLRWDTNDVTKPEGRWNFDALAETIRYVCVACAHAIRDTPAERKQLARSGRFVRLNPNAPRHTVSFTWNALLPPWVTWRSVVEEFLNAQAAARLGDLSPLKTFYNETLGESWQDRMGEIDDFDFLGGRLADYDYGSAWAEERARFMAADKQESGGEHYWWVVRAFGPFGKSRLIAYGRCNTTAELEELRQSYNVPSRNALIDSGFKAREVYRFCAASGWKAFKGDDTPHFLITVPATPGKPARTVRQIWRRTHVDPHYGTSEAGRFKPIGLFQWSNDSTKDLLAEYLTGLVGEFSLPRTVGRDYLKQITAERREEQKDVRGRLRFIWKRVRRDNHLFDCELMILVAAVITKVVATQGPSGMKVEPPEPAASPVA
jgi:phage terminase large subunit GpA-like protein